MHFSVPVGAVIGGTVAGLATIAIIIFTFLYFRKKKLHAVLTTTEVQGIEPFQYDTPLDANSAGLRPRHTPQSNMSYAPTSVFNTTVAPISPPSSSPLIPLPDTANMGQSATSSGGTSPPTHRPFYGHANKVENQLVDGQMDLRHGWHDVPGLTNTSYMDQRQRVMTPADNESAIPTRQDTPMTFGPPEYTEYQ